MARTTSSAANPKARTKRGIDAALMPMTIDKLRKTKINTSSKAAAEQVDPDKPLTEKQKAFVKFWAQGESILSASYKAGYSDNGTVGYRLARMPNVVALYEKEKAAYEESVQMSRKRVMEGFLDAAEMAKLMADPQAMVAAWREVGKLCGYYEPVKKTIDVNVTGDVLIQRMNRLSDAELMNMIGDRVLDMIKGSDDGDEEDA